MFQRLYLQDLEGSQPQSVPSSACCQSKSVSSAIWWWLARFESRPLFLPNPFSTIINYNNLSELGKLKYLLLSESINSLSPIFCLMNIKNIYILDN
jgi:hypothetical protein